jgi:deoxyribodipyrimidine photo-lyase
MRTLVWFRGKDLRVADHVPLVEAARAGDVVPLFVLDPYFFAEERAREMPNRIAFLLASLRELAGAIEALGSRLVVVSGKSVEVVPAVARAFRVDRVVAHRWSEPFGIERDRRVAAALGETALSLYEGETLAAPRQVRTGAGGAFSVFTPFARAFAKTVEIGAPVRAPRSLPPLPALDPADARARAAVREVRIPDASSLSLDVAPGLLAGGEQAANKRLARFGRTGGPGARYDTLRDALGEEGTSRLSQDLKFGTLSARQVWTKTREALADHPKAWKAYANELVWREFAHDVLRESPHVLSRPFKAAWERFPWRRDTRGWTAWVKGTTGYPVVDAAARQLLAEGFVHNRARMIAASFLCKHLVLDFRLGEAHYAKHLTDGDWAANDLGWQWTAGCGVDAAPWFRIFNPVMQGQRFDPDGAYVRRWVPELSKVETKFIHQPWTAPPLVLAAGGVRLGRDYPEPIVDHALARGRFLAAAEGHLAQRRGPA